MIITAELIRYLLMAKETPISEAKAKELFSTIESELQTINAALKKADYPFKAEFGDINRVENDSWQLIYSIRTNMVRIT
jgi:hypothetical protein